MLYIRLLITKFILITLIVAQDRIVPFAPGGVVGTHIISTIQHPDTDKEKLLSCAKSLLTLHGIWKDGVDWSKVEITSLNPGGESTSILKILNLTTEQAVVIKAYKPELSGITQLITYYRDLLTSDFMTKYTLALNAKSVVSLPKLAAAQKFIYRTTSFGTDCFDVMDYAPGYDVWDIFFNQKLLPSMDLMGHTLEEILTGLGSSLAAFHSVGLTDDKRNRLLSPKCRIFDFKTVGVGDANLGNIIWDPKTNSFTFIDIAAIVLSLNKLTCYLDDLKMLYWHTRDVAEKDTTVAEYISLFSHLIDGYCNHPMFGEPSKSALRDWINLSLFHSVRPNYPQHNAALEETILLEDQPGVWQLQGYTGSE